MAENFAKSQTLIRSGLMRNRHIKVHAPLLPQLHQYYHDAHTQTRCDVMTTLLVDSALYDRTDRTKIQSPSNQISKFTCGTARSYIIRDDSVCVSSFAERTSSRSLLIIIHTVHLCALHKCNSCDEDKVHCAIVYSIHTHNERIFRR